MTEFIRRMSNGKEGARGGEDEESRDMQQQQIERYQAGLIAP